MIMGSANGSMQPTERERGMIRPLDQQRCVGLSRICAQTRFYAMG
jgi:hypothetical protein